MQRKIVAVKCVACPKHQRVVPYKHYQTGVSREEPACSSCDDKKRTACNYVDCTFVVT